MRNTPSILKWAFLGLLVATSGLFLSASGCKKPPPPVEAPAPTPTPVIPPGSVVFIQRGHLARLDLETSQIVPLTSGKNTEWFPACSPDGTQVAYWSNRGETAGKKATEGVYNLWKINLDGTGPLRLTDEQTDSLNTSDQNLLVNDAPAWSADSKRIIYSIRGDLWSIEADGYNPETVLIGHSAICPVYSPDGKSVIFISNAQDAVFNIWSFTLSDRSIKKVTNYTDWNVGSPSFSADGSRILFNMYRSNTTQMYTVDFNGGTPASVNPNTRSLCPKYAIKGRKILYCSYDAIEGDILNVFMANANGLEEGKAITTDGGTSPSWAAGKVAVPTPVASPAVPVAGLPTPIGK